MWSILLWFSVLCVSLCKFSICLLVYIGTLTSITSPEHSRDFQKTVITQIMSDSFHQNRAVHNCVGRDGSTPASKEKLALGLERLEDTEWKGKLSPMPGPEWERSLGFAAGLWVLSCSSSASSVEVDDPKLVQLGKFGRILKQFFSALQSVKVRYLVYFCKCKIPSQKFQRKR